MNLFEQILTGEAEAKEVSRLRQGMNQLKSIQAAIDKMPDNKNKIQAQKELNSAIKDLSAREQKTAPKPSAVTTPPPADQTKPAAPQQPTPSAVTTPPQEPQVKRAENPYTTEYKGSSIVDFLAKSGQASDFKSRQALAQRMGIKDYKGTAEQNTQMLQSLQKQAQDFAKTPAVPTERQVAQANVQQPAQFQAGLDKQNTLNKLAPEAEKPFPNNQPQTQTTVAKGPTKEAAAQQKSTQVAKQPASAPQSQTQTTAQSIPSPFMRDMNKLGNALKNSVSNMYGGNNPPKNANVAQQPKPKEKSESEEEKVKKNYKKDENCEDCGLNKITVREKVNISKFLKHLSEKNYSSAHKYLKAIVDEKIQRNLLSRIAKN